MQSWKEEKFSDLMASMRNGLYKKKDFYGEGTQIVKMGELFNDEFITNKEDMDRLELSQKELEKHGLNKGDLLFARRSFVREGSGKCSIVDDLEEPLVPESSIIRARPDESKVTPRFIYYFFRSEIGTSRIMEIVRQTSVSGIAQSDLKNVDVPVPPKPEQKKIATLLNNLDKKVETNSYINELLERISQTLFNHWFIDFGPYDEFKQTKIGDIPEGFEIKKIQEFADITLGNSPKSEYYNENGEGLPFFQGSKNFGLRYPEVERWCNKEKKVAQEDDVLISIRAPVGDVNRAKQKCVVGRGVTALRMQDHSNDFLYHLLKANKQNWEKYKSGTTFDSINKTEIKEFPVAFPPASEIERFNAIVESMTDRFRNNVEENRSLSGIRDTLLPKLMSGEIRVNDINLEDLEVSSEV
jgi:type I restriction enzyme S subunit